MGYFYKLILFCKKGSINMVNIGNEWDDILKNEFKKDYYLNLREILKKEYATYTIYPDMFDIFTAFKETSYSDIKVVILGQDPYHGPNQAHGLAFSVQKGVKIPPSLLNIYKEIDNDYNYGIPNNGYLVPWARQGVFLLNTVLTVRKGEANSHKGIGWETFTDRVIEVLGEREKPMVFMLWGNQAREKENLIKNDKHLILKSPHPSPFSAHRGFLGSGQFSKVNNFLKKQEINEINWKIPNI